MNSAPKADYFSLEVKTRRKDLYDREEELKLLRESLKDPLTVVLGLRRLGKSSLVAVALRETKQPSVTVDLRGVGPNPSPIRVLQRFEAAINSFKSKDLWERLSRVSGVTLFSFGVQFSRSNASRPGIQSLMDSIQDYSQEIGKQFILAVDEVQEARGLAELPAAFAHSYDYNKDVRLVLAGSEVGVLIIAKSKHYRHILKALSTGPKRWKSILEYVEQTEGHISESVFNDSLTYLTKYGIVVKDTVDHTYFVPDPIIGEHAKKL